MRMPMIAGNWKMNTILDEAVKLVRSMLPGLDKINSVEKVVCPPFVSLAAVKDSIKGSSVKLGAQNVFYKEKGAYTGEISPLMLADLCEYVIIGHSERRQYFHETDAGVNEKLKQALKSGLMPIVCIGETLEERKSEATERVVKEQLTGAFEAIPKEGASRAVIAYEPVWAIGTGVVATPEQAQQVHGYIRELLTRMYDIQTAGSIRIQYGGSMKPENAGELLSQPDIDGGLVGGASLDAESFAGIVLA